MRRTASILWIVAVGMLCLLPGIRAANAIAPQTHELPCHREYGAEAASHATAGMNGSAARHGSKQERSNIGHCCVIGCAILGQPPGSQSAHHTSIAARLRPGQVQVTEGLGSDGQPRPPRTIDIADRAA